MSEENNIEVAFINLLETILSVLEPEDKRDTIERLIKILEGIQDEK